jgi:uncharacterized protein YcgL (UPF0745 family)
MDDRLLRAAQHIDKEYFEQFNVSYSEMALKFNKAITRGGDPDNYKDEDLLETTLQMRREQKNEYTVQVEKLPTEVPYLSLDVANEQIEDLKMSLSSPAFTKDFDENILDPITKRLYKRVQEQTYKYKELLNVDKQGWYDQFPKFTYKLNKQGSRNNFDFEDLTENEFIPVFGDSNTVGMGLPVSELWHSKLNEELPIYNAGAICGNLMDAYMLLVSMYKTKKFKKTYICIPHSDRFSAVSDNGIIEGLTPAKHWFLKQFEHSDIVLNNNTRQMYRWVALQGIINFCLLNNIEVRLFDKNTFATVTWCTENELYVPNWMFVFKNMIKGVKLVNECNADITQWPKHVARDHQHFGTLWHDKVAEYMLTTKAI